MDQIISMAVAINNTLDEIPVSGRENIQRLLGCMQAIDKIVEKLQEVQHADKTDEQYDA